MGKNSEKAIPKKDQLYEKADILEWFKLLKVTDKGSATDIGESAAMTDFSSFNCVDKHFTYTLPLPLTDDINDDDNMNNENDEHFESDSNGVSDEVTESNTHFLTIT